MDHDLIVPVYLNQRLVFDLFAMMRGGIATVTRVSEAAHESSNKTRELKGEFGLSQTLASLFRVGLTGGATDEKNATVDKTVASDRVHTPASLFYELRKDLRERRLLKEVEAESDHEAGEIVEFTASLHRNPLIEGFGNLLEIMKIIEIFTLEGGQNHGKKKCHDQPQQVDMKKMKDQVGKLVESLSSSGSFDLVAISTKPAKYNKMLITVEDQFLNDPTMSDIVDGTFRVIGKVIRSVPNSDESINLLRKTVLSRFPERMIEMLRAPFKAMSTEFEMSMPSMETEIKGPVLQVIPLAIFS